MTAAPLGVTFPPAPTTTLPWPQTAVALFWLSELDTLVASTPIRRWRTALGAGGEHAHPPGERGVRSQLSGNDQHRVRQVRADHVLLVRVQALELNLARRTVDHRPHAEHDLVRRARHVRGLLARRVVDARRLDVLDRHDRRSHVRGRRHCGEDDGPHCTRTPILIADLRTEGDASLRGDAELLDQILQIRSTVGATSPSDEYTTPHHPPWSVAMVTLARPAYRNAQSRRLLEDLDAAFAAAVDDPDVRVILLEGEGEHFSSGHDLGTPDELADREARPYPSGVLGEQRRSWGLNVELTLRWRDLAKPTIAAVHGYCIYGGWMIASAMDLIVAADDAKFLPAHFQSFSVPWDLGVRRTKELLWLAEFVSGPHGRRAGAGQSRRPPGRAPRVRARPRDASPARTRSWPR